MRFFLFFIRCIETTIGISGMILILSKLHKEYKVRLKFYTIVAFVFCGLLTATLILFEEQVVEIIWLPLLFVLMLTGLFVTTKDRWQVMLFNLFTQLSIYLLISYIGSLISYVTPVSTEIKRYFYLSIRALLFAAVIFLEHRFIRKPFRRMVDIVHNEWNIAIGIAGGFFILNTLLNAYPMYYTRPDYNYFLIVITYVLMAIVYYCFYIILNNVVLRYQKEQTDAVMNLKLSSLERQIEMQNLATENVRRTRHDLRHNCLVAIGQIQNGDYVGAIDFLKQFTDHVESYLIKNYCRNSSVNCVLSALAQRAENAGICVDIKANVPEKLTAIDEVELTSLIANAFENAIEGCMSGVSDSPFIQIYIDFSDNRVLISVKNSCGEVEFDDGIPVSTKNGGGTGTKSIAYIAQKYHGMADFEACDKVFIMQAYLLDE